LKKIVLISLFSLIVFGGCAYKNIFYSTYFDEISQNLVEPLPENYGDRIDDGETILVTDFVDVNTLENDQRTQLGLILSNKVKSELFKKYNYKIKDIELANRFKINQNGFKLISRNLKELDIKDNHSNLIFIGTYSVTSTKLIVFLRLVDLLDGNILYSTTTQTVLTKEIKDMLKPKEFKRVIHTPLVL
jgi:hypothetical protein